MAFSLPPSLSPANLPRSIEARVPAKILRDMTNRLRFGSEAPLSDECLYVDPAEITRLYTPGKGAPNFRRGDSGRVVPGEWDTHLSREGGSIKFRACLAHFRDGVPWEETGLWEEMRARIARHGSYDGLKTMQDIHARYAALDRLAQEARSTGRLKSRAELPNGYFRREHGGIYVHVTRTGEVVRAGGGQHRFALARALELPEIPVQLGVIHTGALDIGALRGLRRSRYEAGRG
ncbi:hypothetical protein [Primorskyibacter sp. S187A]|uniref:hypothetical protein n=1 Tax=Primorskyibacter sp. S187A TaxID=3415130 RepID=UPI003C7B6B97